MTEVYCDDKRLLWQCRRGMLELDLMLRSFCHKYLVDMSTNEKAVFCSLLQKHDIELWDLLLGDGCGISDLLPEQKVFVDLMRGVDCGCIKKLGGING